MTHTDEVRVLLLHRGSVVLAKVRDRDGVHDVSCGAEASWRCGSCPEAGQCRHVRAALRQLTRAVAS